MNVRDDDRVSAVALVVESEASTAAAVADGTTPIDGDPVDALAAADATAETDGDDAGSDAGDADDADEARRATRRTGIESSLRLATSRITRERRWSVSSSSSSCGTLEVTGR